MNWRKLLRAVGTGIGITLLYGGALFIAFLLGSLGAFPLYMTKVIPVFGAVTLAAAILAVSGYLPDRGKKWLGALVCLVCVGCGAFLANGAYRESLASVDDRELLLWQYEPFREDSRTASLDGPASLKLDYAGRLRLDGAVSGVRRLCPGGVSRDLLRPRLLPAQQPGGLLRHRPRL